MTGIGYIYGEDREVMRSVLARAGDKWSVLIVVLLGDGAQRFTAIKQAVSGITQKVLMQTLRALERDGFVQRTSPPATPARAEYKLTCLGRSLRTAVQPLGVWARAHLTEVNRARAAYDERERRRHAAQSVTSVPAPGSAF